MGAIGLSVPGILGSDGRIETAAGEHRTITLADGSRQVTVNGRPLYLFAKDTKPGDLRGQGVGSVWYVLSPDGTMVTAEAPIAPGY